MSTKTKNVCFVHYTMGEPKDISEVVGGWVYLLGARGCARRLVSGHKHEQHTRIEEYSTDTITNGIASLSMAVRYQSNCMLVSITGNATRTLYDTI